MIVPQTDVRRCRLAWAAKVVCSAVFITGRSPEQALRRAGWILEPAARPSLAVDAARRTVELRLPDGTSAWARMFGRHGAVVVAGPDHQPAALADHEPLVPAPAEACADQRLADAIAPAFAHPSDRTTAFIVRHRGEIVAERYADGFGPSTRFESWSMGKGLVALLVGRMAALRGVDLDAPAGFPEWAHDARRDVTPRQLLQMTSGLTFSGSYGPGEDVTTTSIDGRCPDHVYVYAGGIDAYEFCTRRPLAHPPGTTARYRNGDPLLAARLVRDGVDVPLAAWARANLLDPIDATGLVLEPDPFGNPLLTGHVYGRARDWAHVGQLLLEDGRRLLPSGFVDFMRTPVPAWGAVARGAGVLLNRDGILDAPADAYWLSGGGVNRTVVVPSLDLVMVRLGDVSSRGDAELRTFNSVLRRVIEHV